jgi:hypothetical protein
MHMGSLSFAEGDYLTDLQRLYRVVQIVPMRLKRRGAILEDCRTLDPILVRPRELARMQLHLVRPTPSEETDPEDGSLARRGAPAGAARP